MEAGERKYFSVLDIFECIWQNTHYLTLEWSWFLTRILGKKKNDEHTYEAWSETMKSFKATEFFQIIQILLKEKMTLH